MMKRHYIADILLTAALTGLLAGCTSDEAGSSGRPTGVSDVEILFSGAGVATDAVTRSDASDTYNNALPDNAEIGVYIYDSDGLDLSASQVTGGSTTWLYKTVGTANPTTHKSELTLAMTNHTKNPRFPLTSDNSYKKWVELFAVYPNNPSVKPSTTSYTFTVELDQTDEDNIIAADLLASDLGHYTAAQCEGQLLDLELKHRMAKVKVSFTPKAGSDLTADNMPTDFDVLNVQRAVDITLKTGTITTTGDKTTESAPLKGTTTQSFFIPPQTVNKDTKLLKFNILASNHFLGINGATFAPSATVNFEAGKVYHINVTVDADFITATGTITPWTGEDIPYDDRIL